MKIYVIEKQGPDGRHVCAATTDKKDVQRLVGIFSEWNTDLYVTELEDSAPVWRYEVQEEKLSPEEECQNLDGRIMMKHTAEGDCPVLIFVHGRDKTEAMDKAQRILSEAYKNGCVPANAVTQDPGI